MTLCSGPNMTPIIVNMALVSLGNEAFSHMLGAPNDLCATMYTTPNMKHAVMDW